MGARGDLGLEPWQSIGMEWLTNGQLTRDTRESIRKTNFYLHLTVMVNIHKKTLSAILKIMLKCVSKICVNSYIM